MTTTTKAEPKPKPPPAVALRDLGHIGAGVLRDHKEWAYLAGPWQEPVVTVVTQEMLDVLAADGPAMMSELDCQGLVDEWCQGLVVLPATRFQWAASRMMPPVRTTGLFGRAVPENGCDPGETFYEEDKPIEEVLEVYERGVKGVTAPPSADEVQRAAADRLEQWGADRDDTEAFTRQFDAVDGS